MTLRIIEAPEALAAAFAALEAGLGAWAGARADTWRRDGSEGPVLEGASFARRDDIYLFVEKTPTEAVVGVALTEGDRDLVRVAIPRAAPARDRRRAAVATDDSGAFFLLVGAEELKRQGARDVFRRLAGAPQVKRANLAERDYVLIGPLAEPRCAEALLSVAALHPAFERHVERLGAVAAEAEAEEDRALYRASPQVERRHRIQAKVIRALFERLNGAGYGLETVDAGPVAAEFAMTRGQETLVFEVLAEPRLEALQRALGRLAIVSPRALGLARVLALPTPRDPAAESLEPIEPAFDDMALTVLFFDVADGEVRFRIKRADPSLPDSARAALSA